MLKHHGHDVNVLERTVRDLESRGAGVGTGEEIFAFLEAHDRVKTPFSLPSAGVHVINRDSKVIQEMVIPMGMTTWDAMYYRLRANFDGCTSAYCPVAPADLGTDGKVVYDMGKEVTGIEIDESRESESVTVQYTDKTTNETGKIVTADMVIGADGLAFLGAGTSVGAWTVLLAAPPFASAARFLLLPISLTTPDGPVGTLGWCWNCFTLLLLVAGVWTSWPVNRTWIPTFLAGMCLSRVLICPPNPQSFRRVTLSDMSCLQHRRAIGKQHKSVEGNH